MDAFIKNAFKEISYLKDDNHRMSDLIKSRFEENEKIVKFNIDTLTNEVVKISKETYYEFDQIDSKLN